MHVPECMPAVYVCVHAGSALHQAAVKRRTRLPLDGEHHCTHACSLGHMWTRAYSMPMVHVPIQLLCQRAGAGARGLASPMGGGRNTFWSISSAHGTVGSPVVMVPVGKMPKNWSGRLMGKLHVYGTEYTCGTRHAVHECGVHEWLSSDCAAHNGWLAVRRAALQHGS